MFEVDVKKRDGGEGEEGRTRLGFLLGLDTIHWAQYSGHNTMDIIQWTQNSGHNTTDTIQCT